LDRLEASSDAETIERVPFSDTADQAIEVARAEDARDLPHLHAMEFEAVEPQVDPHLFRADAVEAHLGDARHALERADDLSLEEVVALAQVALRAQASLDDRTVGLAAVPARADGDVLDVARKLPAHEIELLEDLELGELWVGSPRELEPDGRAFVVAARPHLPQVR